MYHLSTRMVSLLLAFGIFFAVSCSTFQSTTESADSLYQSERYSNALRAVNMEIEDEPDNFELQLLKAQILHKYAVESYEPEERESVYFNLRNTTDQINYVTDSYASKTDSILNSAWLHEQRAGVRLLQQDDTVTFDQYFDRVIAHFNNAITIIPDSIVTYNLKATTYYRHGDLSDAISTLESIEDKGLTRPPETCEKLAYLYLEAGQLDRAVTIYESLSANNPDDEIYQQGLVNSYILGERHSEAIALLEELTGVYPNRVEYQEALATEKFYQLKIEINERLSNPASEKFTEAEAEQILEKMNEIGEIYQNVDESLPSEDERQQRIAAFYVDSANLLKRILPKAEDDANPLISDQIETHLRDSIPYWQKLYEANSDRTAYAYSLINVYNELGMEHEAELLQQQINF